MGYSGKDKDLFRETSYTPHPLVLLGVGVFSTAFFCVVVWQCWRLYQVWNTGIYTMSEQLVLAVVYEIALLLSATFAVGLFWLLVDERSAHCSRFGVIPMRLVCLQAALLLLSITAVDYTNNVRLLLRGVETEGVLMESDSPRHHHEAGYRRNRWQNRFSLALIVQTDARVSFRAEDGKLYESLPRWYVFGESLPADGALVRVLYLPDEPSVSKCPGIGMWAVGFIMIPLSIGALCVFWRTGKGGKNSKLKNR